MVDIVIVIERKRHDKEHWIRPGGEQQYRVFFEGEEIGSWRVPEHAAARWLLERGKAQRSDTLRTGGMSGGVGWFADHTVNEKGTPRVVKWVAMQEGRLPRRGVA
jgi:hypothetical protein